MLHVPWVPTATDTVVANTSSLMSEKSEKWNFLNAGADHSTRTSALRAPDEWHLLSPHLGGPKARRAICVEPSAVPFRINTHDSGIQNDNSR